MKQYSFINEAFTPLSIKMQDSKNNKFCDIHIFTRDGDNEPHMHIKSIKLGGKIGLYLRTSSKYYMHDVWINKFKNSKLKKRFNELLDLKDKDGISQWQKIVFLWNKNHEYGPKHCQININKPHPDYTKLP